MRYNNDMLKELELKLNEIKNEISTLENDLDMDPAYFAGRRWTLENMKEWVEGMIANYCE